MNLSYTVKLDKAKLEALIRQSPQDADDALEALAREGERYVKQSFGMSPSPAGGPPGVDTGRLRAAIGVYKPAALQRVLHAGDPEYGPMLEFGTRRMAARPFMAPTVVYLRQIAPGVFKGFLK